MLSRNWTTRNGLPQDHVRAIARTQDGFLWLATDAGLARFDGFEFKTYGLREGLGAVAVMSLSAARDGTLWAGTMGGGVSALRDGKVVETYAQQEGLPTGSVWRMSEDDEGGLWATDRWGHARLSGGRFAPAAGAPDQGRNWLTDLFQTRDGVLWVGVRGKGLWRWREGNWTRVEGRAPEHVTAMCEDAAGRLWAADSQRRLWCLEEGEWKMFPAPEGVLNYVNSLAAAPDGTIWVVYFRAGLRGFRDGEYFTPVTAGEPFFDLAETAYVTPDGQLWLGTSTQGLYALTPAHLKMARVEDPEARQAANFIGALVEEAPGSLLAGTQGRGLHRLGEGRTERVDTGGVLRPGVFVNCMLMRRDGEVLAGTNEGLVRFRDGGMLPWNGHSSFAYDVWDLCEDRTEDGVWVGMGGGGLCHLKDGALRTVSFGSSAVPVKGMAQQADGTLWVGTRGNGLFGREGDVWRRFGKAEGLESEVIRVLHVGGDDRLWVGTAGGGLALKSGERFATVTAREGLPDDTVSQIMEDEEGRLWLGTNRGLAVLSAEEVEGIRQGKAGKVFPRVIDRYDGLLSEEFTIVPPVKMADGRCAFATTQGVALLRLEDFRADETTPPVFLEEVLVDGRPVAMDGGRLEVPPGSKRVEFRFTGLHFAAPSRLRFRNRLAGLEDEWVAAGRERTAVYRNVEPGHYRFEVSASLGNGLWSPQPAAVEVFFRPRFWQTGWFRAGVVAMALGVVAAGARWRERKLTARRIQQLERQRAVDAERARIARDLHDDVGASLTQVALLSQLAGSNLTRRPERAGQHVKEIFETAKEVTRSLDEIVWAVNPQNDTLESFALFLGAFVQNYSHAAGLRCRFDVPEVLPATPLEASIRHHLYLATKEVIHNVAKHAHATEIRLRLALEPGGFRLVIEDDGRGYDSDAPGLPEADGLANLQSRLRQIGGACIRRSSPGRGTTVEMTVPVDEVPNSRFQVPNSRP